MPRTSTTRIAAGVTFRAFTTSATGRSRSSGTAAIPTSPAAREPVSAWNNIDLPELGSPTIPTSSATSAQAIAQPMRRAAVAVPSASSTVPPITARSPGL